MASHTNPRTTHSSTPPAALPPGTIAPPAHAPRPKLHVMSYDRDVFTDAEINSPKEAVTYRKKGRVLWLNIDGVGDAETFEELGRIFKLHPLALEDVVNLHQRPKVEEYGGCVFIVAQMPIPGDDELEFEQLSMFVGEDYVITIQERPDDCLDGLRQRIREARGRVRRKGADYLAYAVLDSITDSYFPVVDELSVRLDKIEERVFYTTDNNVIAEVHDIRHDLHALRQTLAPFREAIGLVMRGEMDMIGDNSRPFFRDCQDHTAQLLDAVEAARSMSVGIMDLHASGVANRMNEVMKVLTLIATIFMPLSFIAGVYGMNFERSASPLNMPELGWAYGYPFALGLMVATTVSLLVYFRRRGWI